MVRAGVERPSLPGVSLAEAERLHPSYCVRIGGGTLREAMKAGSYEGRRAWPSPSLASAAQDVLIYCGIGRRSNGRTWSSPMVSGPGCG